MIYLGLLSFFILEYVRPTSYVPGLEALRLNSLVPLLTFVGALARSHRGTLDRLLPDVNTKLVAGMLGLVGMSVLTADVQFFAYNCFTAILGFALIYWVMVAELVTPARVKGVFAVLIVVHVAVAALNPVLFTDPNARHYIASGSFLGDGNDFALSLDIIIPLCLFLLLDAKKMAKPLFGAALFVLVAVVVLSQSRGGTVGLVAMALYYWMKSRKKAQMSVVALTAVLLIFALAPSGYFERMNQITDTSEGSASARLVAWRVAVQMALDNPLLGVGAAHFGIKFGTEYRPRNAEVAMTAHSIYFLALGELGFPGLALLLYYFGANLSANRKLAVEVQARNGPTRDIDLQMLASTSAALIAFAAAGAFLSALYFPHFYVVAGLLSSTRHVVRQRLAAGEPAVVAVRPALTIHPALRRPAVTGLRTPH